MKLSPAQATIVEQLRAGAVIVFNADDLRYWLHFAVHVHAGARPLNTVTVHALERSGVLVNWHGTYILKES